MFSCVKTIDKYAQHGHREKYFMARDKLRTETEILARTDAAVLKVAQPYLQKSYKL